MWSQFNTGWSICYNFLWMDTIELSNSWGILSQLQTQMNSICTHKKKLFFEILNYCISNFLLIIKNKNYNVCIRTVFICGYDYKRILPTSLSFFHLLLYPFFFFWRIYFSTLSTKAISYPINTFHLAPIFIRNLSKQFYFFSK